MKTTIAVIGVVLVLGLIIVTVLGIWSVVVRSRANAERRRLRDLQGS